MQHVLVIGGTGMLREVSLWLVGQSSVVSVIARSEKRLNRMAEEVAVSGGRVNPLILDYRDDVRLKSAVQEAILEQGQISLVVSWIHGVAPEAHRIIAELLNAQTQPCAWFDVLGSAATDPSASMSDREVEFSEWKHILYRSIVLGFIVEGSQSRWLTDNEISAGVIHALSNGVRSSIVGQVQPWERRP